MEADDILVAAMNVWDPGLVYVVTDTPRAVNLRNVLMQTTMRST